MVLVFENKHQIYCILFVVFQMHLGFCRWNHHNAPRNNKWFYKYTHLYIHGLPITTPTSNKEQHLVYPLWLMWQSSHLFPNLPNRQQGLRIHVTSSHPKKISGRVLNCQVFEEGRFGDDHRTIIINIQASQTQDLKVLHK